VNSGEVSGTTATLVVVDGFTVTVASVGDSRCILDTQGGELQLLTVDHRLEENVEERERVTASGGEVGRLNLFGGQEVEIRFTVNCFLQKKCTSVEFL
jgi:serine/threonine protein phosphatase PrpC